MFYARTVHHAYPLAHGAEERLSLAIEGLEFYADKGNYDRAIADYNKALQINPEYAETYFNRGVAHSLKGDYDRAIEDYTKALQINPQFAVAYLNRGSVYTDKGDYDRAIRDCTKALQINPQYAVAYLVASKLCADLFRYFYWCQQLWDDVPQGQ